MTGMVAIREVIWQRIKGIGEVPTDECMAGCKV